MADDRPADNSSLRILAVDDHHDSADIVVALIRYIGYQAEAAYDGASAIETAKSILPQLILLDLAMPKLDGHAVLRELRKIEELSDTLIVALTGHVDQLHRVAVRESGFDAFLAKPCGFAELQSLLREAESIWKGHAVQRAARSQ